MILISGANSQIGSYLAGEYEASGEKLLLLYHKRKHRIAELRSDKISMDLLDYMTLEQTLIPYLPEVRALIHCGAVRSEDHRALCDTDLDVFKEVFETNVYQAYHLLRILLPAMKANKYGRIVMFTSDVSKLGLPNGSAYAAAKAAIANLAKTAALENANHNVLINCIAPGPVETNMEEDYSEEYLDFRKQYFAQHIKKTATHQLVSKTEIFQLVKLLVSADLRNLCGEEIVVNGGII